MLLGGFVPGVYVTVQILDESVHEDGLNVPPVFPSLHDTVPVGMVGRLEVSATDTVKVTDLPEETAV